MVHHCKLYSKTMIPTCLKKQFYYMYNLSNLISRIRWRIVTISLQSYYDMFAEIVQSDTFFSRTWFTCVTSCMVFQSVFYEWRLWTPLGFTLCRQDLSDSKSVTLVSLSKKILTLYLHNALRSLSVFHTVKSVHFNPFMFG